MLGSTRELKRMLFHKDNSVLRDGAQIITHQSMWQIFSKAQFTDVYYRMGYYRMVNISFHVLIKSKSYTLYNSASCQREMKIEQNYFRPEDEMNCLLTSEIYCFSLLLPQ